VRLLYSGDESLSNLGYTVLRSPSDLQKLLIFHFGFIAGEGLLLLPFDEAANISLKSYIHRREKHLADRNLQ
jgi:hypothetical protein